MSKVTIGFRVEEEIKDRIDAEIEGTALSRSGFIRNAVLRELDEEPLTDRVELLEEAVELLYQKESDLVPLSSRAGWSEEQIRHYRDALMERNDRED